MTEADWLRRAELTSLLRACRSRHARPAVPGRRGGMRQEDVAAVAGLSLRRYAAFERGEFTPPSSLTDQVAAALQMSESERSALHVLATGQDPPRPVASMAPGAAAEPRKALRDLVDQMEPYPAALTDETWRLLHHNRAMSAWAGGWYDCAGPDDRHLTLYLFAKEAADSLPDISAVRKHGIATLRYQYDRNLGSPRFADLVTRLTGGSAEAAELWERHEIAFPPHEYSLRVRSRDDVIIEAHVIFTPIRPYLWLYSMIVPPDASPPHGEQGSWPGR